MIKKQRALQEYYRFNIRFLDDSKFRGVAFEDLNGNPLPDYKSKLTPSQWRLASKYLNRRLVPFCGYEYQAKDLSNAGKIITIK